jgi:hypothetical protein
MNDNFWEMMSFTITFRNRSFCLTNWSNRQSEPTDILQVNKYLLLDDLTKADPSFDYRRLTDRNGDVTGYVWQSGVMRRDFELYGSTLFVDRLGRPLNNKGWPLMTLAMLDGQKTVCLASKSGKEFTIWRHQR